MSYLFIIVGKHDNPIFRLDNSSQKTDISRHLQEFIVHSSLDVIDEIVWKKSDMYLKSIDRFGDSSISAFVTASNVRFMLLHELKTDDGIKNFFIEVYELYMKVLLNPFYTPNSEITSAVFKQRVKVSAKRHLKG